MIYKLSAGVRNEEFEEAFKCNKNPLKEFQLDLGRQGNEMTSIVVDKEEEIKLEWWSRTKEYRILIPEKALIWTRDVKEIVIGPYIINIIYEEDIQSIYNIIKERCREKGISFNNKLKFHKILYTMRKIFGDELK